MRSQEKLSASKNRDRETGRAALPASEDGSVVILALIILMLLTMIGTSATNTSTLELQVAANERHYKRHFFKSEAAALQGAQRIQNALNRSQSWIRDLAYSGSWDHDATPSTNFDTITNWSDLNGMGAEYANTYNLVVFRGLAPGADYEDGAATNLWAYGIYGQYLDNSKNEKIIIETGFARRMP